MSDVADLVDSLKRAVAPLGDFGTVFGEATDEDVVGALMDGFSEAQLDGYFTPAMGNAVTLDLNAETFTPDISGAQGALIVLYAAYRLAVAQLLNMKTRVKYQAGTAIYETETAASVLTTAIKLMADRKTALYTKALYSGANAAFHMADQAFLAATQIYPLPYTAEPYALYEAGGY
jgi:hypothetical protein